MDLIGYLESAAVEADALWAFGNAEHPLGAEPRPTGMSLDANAALARLLEARPTMICMIATPDGGDTDSSEESPSGPVEDEPDEDTPEQSADR